MKKWITLLMAASIGMCPLLAQAGILSGSTIIEEWSFTGDSITGVNGNGFPGDTVWLDVLGNDTLTIAQTNNQYKTKNLTITPGTNEIYISWTIDDWALTNYTAGTSAFFGLQGLGNIGVELSIDGSTNSWAAIRSANTKVVKARLAKEIAEGTGPYIITARMDFDVGEVQLFVSNDGTWNNWSGVEWASTPTKDANYTASFDFSTILDASSQFTKTRMAYAASGNAVVGEHVTLDNVSIESVTKVPPGPPPAVDVIEEWNFDAATHGDLLNAVGTGSTPSDSRLGSNLMGSVYSNSARFAATGALNESFFLGKTDTTTADMSNGVLQISWDVTAADFALTAATNGTAQGGFGFRDKTDGNKDDRALLRFQNDSFVLSTSSGDGSHTYQLFAGNQISSNLNIRLVYDLDNAGDLGSFQVFSTYGSDAEVEHGAGTMSLHAGFVTTEFRGQFQALNGGNLWQVGDTMDIDNIKLAILTPDTGTGTPDEQYTAWLGAFSVGTDTNLTDDADNDLLDNLTEYAFGGAPDDIADQGNTPVQSQTSEGGTNYIEYVYFERDDAAARGLASILNVGTDLVITNWTTSGIEFVGSGAGPAGFTAVTNRISTDDDATRFLHLQIEFTP